MQNKKKINLYIIYHCTNFVPFKTFKLFVRNYIKYSKNYKHQLIICFKNLGSKELFKYKKELKKINYISFVDKEKVNDFDFGSYKRIAEKYKKSILLFLNGHSYPLVNNWIKILMKHYKSNRIIASSASYESLRDLPFNLRNNLLKNINHKLYYYLNFYGFPNPHFRTTGFIISAKNFLRYPFKKIKKKSVAHLIESGKNNMYQFFKKLNIKTFVVNSDGKKFEEKNWRKSETYACGDQSKLIISDNRTRYFEKMNKFLKFKKENCVWGEISG